MISLSKDAAFFSNPLPNNPICRRDSLKKKKRAGGAGGAEAALSSLGAFRRLCFKLCCGLLPPCLCKTVDLGSHAFRWDLQHTNQGRCRNRMSLGFLVLFLLGRATMWLAPPAATPQVI